MSHGAIYGQQVPGNLHEERELTFEWSPLVLVDHKMIYKEWLMCYPSGPVACNAVGCLQVAYKTCSFDKALRPHVTQLRSEVTEKSKVFKVFKNYLIRQWLNLRWTYWIVSGVVLQTLQPDWPLLLWLLQWCSRQQHSSMQTSRKIWCHISVSDPKRRQRQAYWSWRLYKDKEKVLPKVPF